MSTIAFDDAIAGAQPVDRLSGAAARRNWEAFSSDHAQPGTRELHGRSALAFCMERANGRLVCWEEGSRRPGFLAGAPEIARVLDGPELHPEGELRAVSEDGMVWLQAFRGEGRVRLAIMVREPQ